MTKRLAVFAGGRGSNAAALYDAMQAGEINGTVVVVVSDNPKAKVLDRAAEWGVRKLLGGMDLKGDPLAMQRLKEAAEKAKIELSSSTQTDVNLPYITADQTGPKHLNVKISRAKLEALVEDLVARTIEPCRIALKDAGIDASKIDDVILETNVENLDLLPASMAFRPSEELTPREAECLQWAAAGLPAQVIAKRMGISVATVNSFFLPSIRRKLGAASTIEAVSLAFRHRLIRL